VVDLLVTFLQERESDDAEQLSMSETVHGLLLDIGNTTLTTADLVRDKPLWAVPAQTRSDVAAAEMARQGFDVAPLTELPVARYVVRPNLEQAGSRPAEQVSLPITGADRITEDEPLGAALEVLRDRPFVFVVHRQHTTGILTRADLEQPIVGLHAFGLILSLEAAIDALLSDFKQHQWLGELSEDRRQRIVDLHEERRNTDTDLDLLRSLNLDDRLTIARKLGLHEPLGFTSVSDFKKWSERLKRIRNALAHGSTLLSAVPDPTEALGFLQQLRDTASRAWSSAPRGTAAAD